MRITYPWKHDTDLATAQSGSLCRWLGIARLRESPRNRYNTETEPVRQPCWGGNTLHTADSLRTHKINVDKGKRGYEEKVEKCRRIIVASSL